MRQTWRWFGPQDTVSVDDMLQAGVQGVVSALHHIPAGSLWSVDEICKRQTQVSQLKNGRASNLSWEVVESLPVSEEIKRQSGDWRIHVDHYRQSLQNLAACGIEVVCYNFMPVLDWTRTDVSYVLPNGAKCMRFDVIDFAIFDVYLLKRTGARDDFPLSILEEAESRFATMSEVQLSRLSANIVCGLPGAASGYTLEDLQEQLALYKAVSADRLRQHQIDFLTEVVPTAEQCGLRLCCHPDDPPFSLLGLPRIMSSEADYNRLMQAVDSPASGITLCSGSMSVLAENDLPGMVKRLGDRVHFVHLRNVQREAESEGVRISFHESEHLTGATDMVELVGALLAEEKRRAAAGRQDHIIPFRPDHGQEILSDLDVAGQPGYPAVGRLKGLAELRGVQLALSKT